MFVRRLAESMGVQGEVWNRHDGAVELYASHEDASVLQAFEARLTEGPGHVQEVDLGDLPDGFEAPGFRIGATRP